MPHKDDVAQLKQVMRKEMVAKLKPLSQDYIQIQSNSACQNVIDHPTFIASERVAIYLHMGNELQTTAIVEALLDPKSGKECFIPVTKPNEMKMVRLKDKEDFLNLKRNRWNILEPSEEREDALATGGLDLIICPGLAFDLEGRRLGRGKGYYDKYLAKARKSGCLPQSIGLALNEQIVKRVPADGFDFVLGAIVSPNHGC
jgi:5-formyltetrahydrofolate cyclo-ligase